MHTPLAEVGQAKQPLPQPGGGFGICDARPVFIQKVQLFLAEQDDYITEARDTRPHAMATATASDQKKTGDIANSRYRYLCFFDACSLVCFLACLLACLFVCLFVSLFAGPTQWLQPLHRTKKKQATLQIADIGFVCLFV